MIDLQSDQTKAKLEELRRTRPLLRVKFVDLCSNPDEPVEECIQLLNRYYTVEKSESPDAVFCTGMGTSHRHYDCFKFWYTGENMRPPVFAVDYALSHDEIDHPRHTRWPHYALYRWIPELEHKDSEKVRVAMQNKPDFCSYVFSNSLCDERIKIFHLLNEYKRVNSGGRVMNNVGGPVPSKHKFLQTHKFDIAFENSSHLGYTTEKIADAMRAHCVPIYWGNLHVAKDFNPESFINAHDFDSLNSLVDYVIKVDQDQELYEKVMMAPWLHGDQLEYVYTRDGLADLMAMAIQMGRAEFTLADRGKALAYYTAREARAFSRNAKRAVFKVLNIKQARRGPSRTGTSD